jgi:hypothetical protein
MQGYTTDAKREGGAPRRIQGFEKSRSSMRCYARRHSWLHSVALCTGAHARSWYVLVWQHESRALVRQAVVGHATQ